MEMIFFAFFSYFWTKLKQMLCAEYDISISALGTFCAFLYLWDTAFFLFLRHQKAVCITIKQSTSYKALRYLCVGYALHLYSTSPLELLLSKLLYVGATLWVASL